MLLYVWDAGEEGLPVLQGGQGDPVPGVRRAGAHDERPHEAAQLVPAHRRARLVGAGGLPRAVSSGGSAAGGGGRREQQQPLQRRLLQWRRRQCHGEPERRQQHLRVPDQDGARVARRGLPPGRRRRRLLRQAVSGRAGWDRWAATARMLSVVGGPRPAYR